MKSKRGYTLIEILIVVAIVGIIGAVVIGIGARGCISARSEAEAGAKQYAADLGLNYKGVSCADMDSDGDGYVSCSISTEQGGKVSVIPVECAGKFTLNSGCRAPKAVMPGAVRFGQ